MRLELGKPIRGTDKVFGELADVVIDPIANRVTHLVAQPSGGDGSARLVPIELVEAGGGDEDEIRLRCTTEDILGLDDVQEVAYLRLGESPTSDPDWDVGVENVLALPYYPGSEFTGLPGIGEHGRHRRHVPPCSKGGGRDPTLEHGVCDRRRVPRQGRRIRRRRRSHHASRPRARAPLGEARDHDPDWRGRKSRDRRDLAEPLEGRGRSPTLSPRASLEVGRVGRA